MYFFIILTVVAMASNYIDSSNGEIQKIVRCSTSSLSAVEAKLVEADSGQRVLTKVDEASFLDRASAIRSACAMQNARMKDSRADAIVALDVSMIESEKAGLLWASIGERPRACASLRKSDTYGSAALTVNISWAPATVKSLQTARKRVQSELKRLCT